MFEQRGELSGFCRVLIEREDNRKVRIDYDLRMGDQNCHKVCPEVFDFDQDKLNRKFALM